MYSKPQAVPADDILDVAANGAIVIWVFWGFPAGGNPKDSDQFFPYPRPVCEELTKALVAKANKTTSHVDLPASEEYPADSGSRKVGFVLFPEEDHYIQHSLAETWRQRRCFPCPVRWLWNKSSNPDREAELELFPTDVAWALEHAYAARHTVHQFTDAQGKERIVRLMGYPMFQMPLDRPLSKRIVRREGPALFPTQLGFVRNPSGPLVSCQRKWVKDDNGVPVPRVQLSQAEVQQFVDLMDRATQWHSFSWLSHCNLGCVPGPGRIRTQKFRVVNVERVQAPVLWEAYAARRQELRVLNCGSLFPMASHSEQADFLLKTAEHFDAAAFFGALDGPVAQLDSSVNEVLLFHGTRKQVINNVTHATVSSGHLEGCKQPLSMNERTADVASALGRGIYFADLASKSNLYVPCPDCGCGSYQCQQECTCSSQPIYQMLLCRVLLGRIWQENEIRGENFNYYKEEENLQHVLKDYDSVFVPMDTELGNNNTSCTFREWAVYASNHVYPEFVISYTRHKS